MTKTNIDVAQILESFAESQKAMLNAIQSINARIDALEKQSDAPAEKTAHAEKTAPKTADPKKNWPKWALLPGVIPNGYVPLFGVTLESDGYIQGYGFSYKKNGDETYIVMKGFSFDEYTSKEGKTFPAGSRGKPIRMTLQQWTALFHVLRASLEALYGSKGIPAADISTPNDVPAPAPKSAPIDPATFICPECGQGKFQTLSGIKRHYTTKHKGITCPVS